MTTPSARIRTGAPASSLRAPNYLLVKAGEGASPRHSPHLFKTAPCAAGRFDFMVGSFAPMTGPPLHLHREQDDTFYILEGILRMEVADEVFDIGPGDFLSIPPGVPHSFDNFQNDGCPVRAINLMTPGGLFDMFDEMAGVDGGPRQEETLRQVAERYGTEIVGPPLRIRMGIE